MRRAGVQHLELGTAAVVVRDHRDPQLPVGGQFQGQIS
jgi:hypothetical protein